MADSYLKSVFRSFPPVARRDARLERLERRLAELEYASATSASGADRQLARFRNAFVRRSSFQARVHAERRLRALADEIGAPPASVIQHGKFHVYELARSHGIDAPRELRRWDDPRDIVWEDLPDLVVVKSAFGSTSRGVFPLRRVADGWQVVTHDETLSADHVTSMLAGLVDDEVIRPPFVAEEFLDEDGTGTTMPTDVKAYAFYGEVPMVVLRRPSRHADNDAPASFRVIDGDGADVTDFRASTSTIDSSMPVPDQLATVIEAASRFSIAIRAPFSRIDFYCVSGRVVFGEVTPRPGGNNWFGPTVDERLGDAWDRATTRLARDVGAGMSPEPERGTFETGR